MENDNKLILLTFLGAKIENNRIISEEIIASFLGANSFATVMEDEEEHYNIIEDVGFDTSWDWLMLVVDKIESLDNIISFKITSYIEIEYWTNNGIGLISITDVKPKIEATYKACLEFVKWYNKQSK